MNYFNVTHTAKSDKTVSTGSDSPAYSLVKLWEGYGHESHDYMIAKPQVFTNQNKCLISTALFWLGVFEPVESLTYSYNDSTPLTLSQIGDYITSRVPHTSYSIVNVTKNNMKSALDNGGLVIAYLPRTRLMQLFSQQEHFGDTNQSIMPVMVWGFRDDVVDFYSIQHTGLYLKGKEWIRGVNHVFISTSEFVENATNTANGFLNIYYTED